MAINIFQGNSSKKSKANTASNSTRAQQAKEALTGASETSSSGATAVKTSGTMAKIGNTVGKIANVASKFLPGVGGTIAKGVASIFNDPEWWQSVPGNAITLNAPLLPVQTGTLRDGSEIPYYQNRAVILALDSATPTDEAYLHTIMNPTIQMVTQYLMPQVRKVVNAVPLQSAEAYRNVLAIQATLYALWRQLRRDDYLLKHGQPFIPNLNVAKFPILQVDNAAYLQSTIGRLEEYLRANVRLPHTLCEYLAWRYGRIYKANSSAKSALVMYNVVAMTATTTSISSIIDSLMERVSASVALQQANTDLYNTYFDHDLAVEIRDDTQCKYDAKEFMLRTNLDLLRDRTGDLTEDNNPVLIDSDLDNPTVFMASTISTLGRGMDGETSVLFPVYDATIYGKFPFAAASTTGFCAHVPAEGPAVEVGSVDSDKWFELSIGTIQRASSSMTRVLTALAFCKTVELYNKDIIVKYYQVAQDGSESVLGAFDVTALSMDLGLVSDEVLGNEHVYAFANLVDVDRKHSMSYAKAEKLVARDVANMVETLDIATVATPSTTNAVKPGK